MQAFVAWSADDIDMDAKLRTQGDDVDGLRRLQQQIDLSDEIWKSFVLSCDGNTISAGSGKGVVEVPVSHLSAIPKLQLQYGKSLNSKVSIGIGMKLHEAQIAREVAKKRGADEVVFYSPEIEDDLKDEEKKDVVKDIADRMSKAEATPEPLAPTHGGPTSPERVSEHSQAEGLREEIGGDPPAPEMTHAAAGLEDKMHEFAQAQDQKDQQQQHVDAHADLKKEIAAVLQRVKEQVPILGQLKQSAPDSYQVIMDLVQSVIKMARGLGGGGSPLAKSDRAVKIPRRKKQPPLENLQDFPDEDLASSNFHEGDQGKLDGNFDDYDWKWHPSFDLGNLTVNPLHYADTIREGRREYWKRSSLHPDRATSDELDDKYPNSREYLDDVEGGKAPDPYDVFAGFHEWIREPHKNPVTLIQTTDGGIRAKDGNHRIGYAIEKGVTKLPAIVGVLKNQPTKKSEELEKAIKLPMPRARKRKHLSLPAGTIKDSGPSGTQEVGKVKVNHGDGTSSWISARAGMVTAVADRHADPVLGQAGHPISSRNVTGH